MGPRWFRHLFNIYPPYVGAGVHVREIAPDWRFVRVQMRLRWYNRNYVGTHFGGSLFSMTDPFLMIMVMKNLGEGYLVWDKAAQIDYVAPGRGTVTADFRVTDAELDELRAHTTDGRKYLRWFDVDVRGEDGTLVARLRKQLYVKRKGAPRTSGATEGGSRLADDERPPAGGSRAVSSLSHTGAHMNTRTRTFAALAVLVFAAGWFAGASAQQARRFVEPRSASNATLPPFSGAAWVGDTLYLAGTIGVDANQRVPDTAEAEARAVLTNVQNTLKAAGLTMDDLVSVQVFCSDVAHYDAFNKVYRTFFTKEFPARAFIGSGKLLFGARFEVQGIAARR
jgi:reactive intermediate/imine deaminase